MRLKRALVGLLVLALLATPFLIYFNATALQDWWALHDYSPPQAIVSLANQDTMTAYTKHMFYLNHPQIVSGVADFRKDCPDSTTTIVLGCYHPNQDGIYIYAVSDPQLYGVEQVTAAHEVLHAVYARLSAHDRSTLDAELQSYYQNGLNDPQVMTEVKLYQQTEPGAVMDEMSCTFGTEIASLPPALEAYYDRYFTNRQAIVQFEQMYNGEFSSRQSQISAYAAQLSALKNQINLQEQSLQTQLNQINSDRAKLDSLRSSGQADTYNSALSNFNEQVSAYNNGVDRLKSDISTYNEIVDQYNAVAQELAGLEQAIDTRLAPQAAQ